MSSEPPLRLIDADGLRRSLPMRAAIDALEAAFRDQDPSAGTPLRTNLSTAAGTLLVMPAYGASGVGAKLVTLTPGNPGRDLPFVNATYVLFDASTQRPEAVIDGAALTALRTGALSGLATRFLARSDASRVVIFGAGVQARVHLEAMRAVRPVSDLVVVSRSRGPADALAQDARSAGLDARVGEAEDVTTADLVCTCTTSSEPVFDGRLLRPGSHVNAVGAYTPGTRELDDVTVRGADVVVETAEVALAEAGDLLLAYPDRAEAAAAITADLSSLVRGTGVRTDETQRTVFISVGSAFEDLVVARAAVDAATG